MRIDPQVAALRNDLAAQRRAQQTINSAVESWKKDPALTPILQQFARYAVGDAVEALNALQAIVQSAAAAEEFIANWLDVHVAALREGPLAQIPFRHSYSAGFATMQLLAKHGASLALAVYEERAEPVVPTSAIFSDREQHEVVVAGHAEGLFSAMDPKTGKVVSETQLVAPGNVIQLDCNTKVRQWTRVEGRLVLLQLSRTPENAKPTRELRLDDGALLLQSDGDKRTSQASVALAVLGALERSDAVPAMDQISRAGPAHLRWEAVRQMLTIDPVHGVVALDRMALDPADELKLPAEQLAARLRALYPALREGKAA